jgi:pre-mRNA-splicing factor SYF2/beta-D-xylosidase 4
MLPWCNYSLPIDDRVADMVKRMTLKEKIPNLNTGGGAIPSLGLNAYNWWEEASSGVSNNGHESTKFAFPITTGMSFNRTLWKLTGRQIGHEARALMNAGKAGSTFWAPVINLAREPRWGRNIEVPGEDPYHVGEYAEAFVKGFEQAPEDEGHIQASACCKHYAANSMEHTTEGGQTHTRHDFSATISQQDLVDSYLSPFQACVEKGRVSGLMCSYNAINGVPSCANDWLLDQVARGDWGFDGYITSDCDADADVYNKHHYMNWTKEETVAGVLKAGTDVDCTSFVGQNAQSALDQKLITEADIDEHLRVLFKVRMRLGHFDPVGPLQGFPLTDVCSQYAIDLANNGPVQSSALLKNANHKLPLQSTVKTVAVIGPNANLSKADVTYYGPRTPCNSKYWTMADAVETHSSAKATTLAGVPTVLSSDTSGIAAAVALAKSVDEVILAVGTDLTWAHEEHDADSITFTDAQLSLISQVASAAKNPVTLITYTATPLDISAQMANDKIGAILHIGQPSVTVVGVGELLFGKTSPAGRTVQTIYPASYAAEVSIFDFNMRPGPSNFPRPDCEGGCGKKMGTNPGRTHRFYTGKAVVPFGFGLSYTSFTYEPQASTTNIDLSPVRALLEKTKASGKTFPSLKDASSSLLVSYNVKVTNTGEMDADDVVLGFLVPPNAGQDGNPLQTLFAFERVHVKKGESVVVNLYPSLLDFTRTLIDGSKEATSGEWTVKFGVQQTAEFGGGYAESSLKTF